MLLQQLLNIKTQYLFPLACLVLALISISLAVHGYYTYVKCDYVQKLSSKQWRLTSGYFENEFEWLFFGTYLYPVGICSLCIFIVQFQKSKMHRYFKLLIFYGLLGVTFWCIAAAYNNAFEILSCGVFCVGDATLTKNEVKNGEAHVSMIFFFCAMAFSFILIGAILKTHGDQLTKLRKVPNGNVESHISKQGNYWRKKTMSIILAFIVLFPFMFICCVSLPTSWKNFSVLRIRTFQISEPLITSTAGVYSPYWKLHINKFLLLKLYPDILFYYGSMYLVLFVAGASYKFPRVRNLLHMRPTKHFSMRYGEFFLFILTVGLIIGQFCYQYQIKSGVERAALAVAQTTNLVAGLLTLPVARNSVWSILFGVSWNSMLRYHQFLGYTMIILAFVHCFLFWRVYAESDTFPGDILAVPTKVHANNPSTPMIFITMLLALVFMVGLSLPYVRRVRYELFYYAHHFAMIMFLVMLWHAIRIWYFIIAGLILWAADHAVRLLRCIGTTVEVKSLEIVGNDDIVKVSYTAATAIFSQDKSNFTYRVGQYCFINFPSISSLEWHPFTLSSTPDATDGLLSHHIKSKGPLTLSSTPDVTDGLLSHHIQTKGEEQWTAKLLALAKRAKDDSGNRVEDLIMIIDGPYGEPLIQRAYSHVLLIAGGIGITPIQAIFQELYRGMKEGNHLYQKLVLVRLLWIVKTDADLNSFREQLTSVLELESKEAIFSISFHITGCEGIQDLKGDPLLHYGRPDLSSEILALESYHMDTAVVACGPSSMIDSCSRISSNVDFISETFEF